jgi:hypothetical protein
LIPARVVILGLVSIVAFSLVPATTERTASVPAPPRFVDGVAVSADEGHVVLSWTPAEGDDPAASRLIFELEQSADPAFGNHRLRHRGAERSFFVTGLPEGQVYFRVRAVSGETAGRWSETIAVDVVYPGRLEVLALVSVGCLVFLATVTAILVGWARSRREEPAESRVLT